MKLLYCIKWLGSISVNSIRVFDTEDDLMAYVGTLREPSPGMAAYRFVYEVAPDCEAKLVERELLEKVRKP